MPPTEAEIAEKQKAESGPALSASTQRGDVGAGTQSAKYGQKPSPCRLVMFNHTADTIGHHMGLDGKLKIDQSPAVVLFVNPDGTLRLSVFQQFGGANKIEPRAEQYVAEQGSNPDPPPPNGPPGTWQWPERV